MANLLYQNHAFCRFVNQIYLQSDLKHLIESFCANANINQNILLFCCWYPSQGTKLLSKKDLRDIISEIIPWHNNVVLALENILNKLNDKTKKNEHNKLSEAIKKSLFVANQYEQLIIANHLTKNFTERNNDRQLFDAMKNINTYCRELSVIIGNKENEIITNLIAVAYP